MIGHQGTPMSKACGEGKEDGCGSHQVDLGNAGSRRSVRAVQQGMAQVAALLLHKGRPLMRSRHPPHAAYPVRRQLLAPQPQHPFRIISARPAHERGTGRARSPSGPLRELRSCNSSTVANRSMCFMAMQKYAYLHWSGSELIRIGGRYNGWCDDGRRVAQRMMRHLNRAR